MLPRHTLPQIPADKLEEFKKYCEGKNISCSYVRIPVGKIIPIQKVLNKKKIKNIIDEGHDGGPLVISSDNKLLDGHHRWAADVVTDKTQPVTCLKIECPMEKLISLGHTFDGSEMKSVSESLFI